MPHLIADTHIPLHMQMITQKFWPAMGYKLHVKLRKKKCRDSVHIILRLSAQCTFEVSKTKVNSSLKSTAVILLPCLQPNYFKWKTGRYCKLRKVILGQPKIYEMSQLMQIIHFIASQRASRKKTQLVVR